MNANNAVSNANRNYGGSAKAMSNLDGINV